MVAVKLNVSDEQYEMFHKAAKYFNTTVLEIYDTIIGTFISDYIIDVRDNNLGKGQVEQKIYQNLMNELYEEEKEDID